MDDSQDTDNDDRKPPASQSRSGGPRSEEEETKVSESEQAREFAVAPPNVPAAAAAAAPEEPAPNNAADDDPEEAERFKKFIRKRNALYSRRKYYKMKIEAEVVQGQVKKLSRKQVLLKQEQARLMDLLEQAHQLCQKELAREMAENKKASQLLAMKNHHHPPLLQQRVRLPSSWNRHSSDMGLFALSQNSVHMPRGVLFGSPPAGTNPLGGVLGASLGFNLPQQQRPNNILLLGREALGGGGAFPPPPPAPLHAAISQLLEAAASSPGTESLRSGAAAPPVSLLPTATGGTSLPSLLAFLQQQQQNNTDPSEIIRRALAVGAAPANGTTFPRRSHQEQPAHDSYRNDHSIPMLPPALVSRERSSLPLNPQHVAASAAAPPRPPTELEQLLILERLLQSHQASSNPSNASRANGRR